MLLSLAAIERTDFDAALREILRVDAEALGVGRVSFWSLENEPPALECEALCAGSGTPAESAISRLDAGRCPRYFDALGEERVIAVDDTAADPITIELRANQLLPPEVTCRMDVPVRMRGRLAGILCHEHVARRHRWDAAERDLAVAIAQALSTALEARERACAEASNGRCAFLARASVALAETLDVDEIPQRLARLTVPFLGDWCAIHVFSAAGELVRHTCAHAEPSRQRDLNEHCREIAGDPEATRRLGQIARARTPVVLASLTDELSNAGFDPAFGPRLRKLGAATWMAIPLVTRGAAVGIICFGAGSRRFHQRDVDLATEVAGRAAIAIDNGCLYHEAVEAVRVRDEFLSIASHELRTPITSLQLAVQGLRHGAVSPERLEKVIKLVERQTRRLAHLTGELLDVARLQVGKAVLSYDDFDLVEIAHDVIAQFEPRLASAKMPLTFTSPQTLRGRWDRVRIEQVLTNLIENSIKFGRGAPLEIVLACEATRARFTVRDHGIGIAPERLPYVFERYERGVDSREYGGLGLGLYISRMIVEEHGGTIGVASKVGEGAEFDVSLPLEPAE